MIIYCPDSRTYFPELTVWACETPKFLPLSLTSLHCKACVTSTSLPLSVCAETGKPHGGTDTFLWQPAAPPSE